MAPPSGPSVMAAQNDIWADLARIGLIIRLEPRVLGILVSYAMAIGIVSLVIPPTVQELTPTFAYAIEPIMIVTFALIVLIGLLFIGFFRVRQTSAMETCCAGSARRRNPGPPFSSPMIPPWRPMWIDG